VLPKDAGEAGRQAVMGNIVAGPEELGEYGGRAGVDILIETHGDFIDSRLLRELMAQVTSPAVGVLWDTHHPWRFLGEPVAVTFDRLTPWVRHTHWKDSVSHAQTVADETVKKAAEQAHALMSGHRHADYVLFGDGEFPAAECVRLLRAAGYTGWLSLEWEKMWHPQIEGPDLALPPFAERIRKLW
jgi:sugar phosphate isomerase/epimerase